MSTDKYILQELIDLRRHFHKHPEPSFQEHATAATIIKYLTSKGIPPTSIVTCASPGFYVDVRGTALATASPPRTIACRADMDGLVMPEANAQIDYASVTNAAHMCGHDGHMVCLMGAVARLLDNLHRLPSNNTVRFLFQPAEEDIGGAKVMVEQGCMDGVDEVWGVHNTPWRKDTVYVKEGPMLASVSKYRITVEGEGGHSSLKKQLRNPVLVLCEFNLLLEESLARDFKGTNDEVFTFCLPCMKTSDSDNVIPTTAYIEGVLRSLDESVEPLVATKMDEIAAHLELKHRVKITVDNMYKYPLTTNSGELVEHVLRLRPDCKNENLPKLGAEDFSEFGKKAPSCFMMYGIGEQAGMPHTNNYNFNDECIEGIVQLWLDIIGDRLSMVV